MSLSSWRGGIISEQNRYPDEELRQTRYMEANSQRTSFPFLDRRARFYQVDGVRKRKFYRARRKSSYGIQGAI